MNKIDDLKIIKKYYGEDMMHLCRSIFSTILDIYPGKLQEVMLSHFDSTRYLYTDIVNNKLETNFKNYIYSFFPNEENNDNTIKVSLTPFELMRKVGYTLYECHTESDIQKFKKYYEPTEKLCTFKGGRLNNYYVFFAVKDNAPYLKRRDFKDPKREDEYGTSVVSIQFTKDSSHTLSIKNRYNHTVDNPDSTFSNNLENIVDGLTVSFEKTYGLIQKIKNNDFEIPGYVKANDGKFYKYNYEIDNVYYCPNNIIITDFAVKKYPKEKYLIFDYFILDLMNKTISCNLKDSFIESVGTIKNIKIINNTDYKEVIITPIKGFSIYIKLDKQNKIIEYINPNVRIIEDNFLYFNKDLNKMELLNVEEIKNYFLHYNTSLIELDMPKLIKVYNNFLTNNFNLRKINMPNLEEVGYNFLSDFPISLNIKYSKNLKLIYFPKLRKVDNNFMLNYCFIKEAYLPSLEMVKDNFLSSNNSLTELNLPKLKKAGNWFLAKNEVLTKLFIPYLEEVGVDFLDSNISLFVMEAPNLKIVDEYFLANNKSLQELNLPNLEKAGNYFLKNNEQFIALSFPNLRIVSREFLKNSKALEVLYVPNLEYAGYDFLNNCYSLKEITIPNIYFINNPKILKRLVLYSYKKRILEFLLNKGSRTLKKDRL